MEISEDDAERLHFCVGKCSGLLTIVPNIGREFPVISDLFPNHNILPGYFLWCRGLGPQAEGPDLPCRGGTERFDVEVSAFRIANLFRHAFPHSPNRSTPLHPLIS